MTVRLTHLDGSLPNLALMKLASWHRSRGDDVVLKTEPERDLFESSYETVYGSSIFTKTIDKTNTLRSYFPDAIIGGTGTADYSLIENITGDHREYDYSIYPDYKPSLGFTQRGCRMKCKFCVVPQKEGKVKHENTIAGIWRGQGHPRKIMLLDNDFFGNQRWLDRIREIVDGNFKVCFTQGINVRLIGDVEAEAMASVQYRDSKFRRRRIYTAWDSLGHEKIFFRGIDRLIKFGVNPNHIMVYMLTGFAKDETLEQIQYRFKRMVDYGLLPYPMVYDETRRDLKRFQRWAVTGLYRTCKFEDYDTSKKSTN